MCWASASPRSGDNSRVKQKGARVGRVSAGFRTKQAMKMLLARSPDIAMSVFLLLAAVLAVQESFIAEFLADELSLWFIYELVGAYFLLLWVALNERRKTQARNDVFRFASTCVVYFGCAMLMHFVFRASLSSATMSAVGGIWALLNPLVRYDDLTVFKKAVKQSWPFLP